nr:patatin-like phospholipase family protein [Sedimentibacter sp. zth1]
MKNYGLVLGGGGAKGAYQIGVLHALSHYEIYNEITAISGTSIGALNMVLTQQLSTFEAIDIWKNDIGRILFNDNISTSEIMDMLRTIKTSNPPDKAYLKDRVGLVKFFKSIKLKNLSYSKNKLFATCTDVTKTTSKSSNIEIATAWYNNKQYGKASYLPINNQTEETIYKILLASSAIPLIYQPVQINGKYYADGGLTDNLPINPINNLYYKHIIAISCRNVLNAKLKSRYPNSTIYFIKPSFDLGNLFSGTLNFNKEKISHMINLGYKDGLQYIKNYIIK